MPRLASLVDKLAPPRGVARALAVQSVLYATGSGIFLAGSAVFFTRVLHLRPAEVQCHVA